MPVVVEVQFAHHLLEHGHLRSKHARTALRIQCVSSKFKPLMPAAAVLVVGQPRIGPSNEALLLPCGTMTCTAFR